MIKIIPIIGCCVSDMRKSAMITEIWTLQTNHRDNLFPYILLLLLSLLLLYSV